MKRALISRSGEESAGDFFALAIFSRILFLFAAVDGPPSGKNTSSSHSQSESGCTLPLWPPPPARRRRRPHPALVPTPPAAPSPLAPSPSPIDGRPLAVQPLRRHLPPRPAPPSPCSYSGSISPSTGASLAVQPLQLRPSIDRRLPVRPDLRPSPANCLVSLPGLTKSGSCSATNAKFEK